MGCPYLTAKIIFCTLAKKVLAKGV